MSYNVSFISLGCAKNQVNCEQMMALCAEAGYSIQAEPAGGEHLRLSGVRLRGGH